MGYLYGMGKVILKWENKYSPLDNVKMSEGLACIEVIFAVFLTGL